MKMVSINADALFYFGTAVYRIVDVTDEHVQVIRNNAGIIPGVEPKGDDERVRIRRPKAARTHVDRLAQTVNTAIAGHVARLAA